MKDKSLIKETLGRFTEEVSLPGKGTPAAGSTASLTAALTVSLLELIANLAGEQAGKQDQEILQEISDDLENIQAQLLHLVDADAEILAEMVSQGADHDGEQNQQILCRSILIPEAVALLALEICRLAEKLSVYETEATAGDAAVAGYLSKGVVSAMAEVTRQNSLALVDRSLLEDLIVQTYEWEREAQEVLNHFTVTH